MQASTYKAYEPEPLSNSSGYRKVKGRRKKLTAQKKKEIKEAFDLFDIDGSGIILTNEIHPGTWRCGLLFLSHEYIQAPSMQGSSTLR